VLAYEPSAFDPAPIPYDALSLDARLLSGIKDLGWSETRPVQSGVIPLALAGSDVIACAETGTGKTAAFLVPILQRFLNEPAPAPPRTRALILAPSWRARARIRSRGSPTTRRFPASPSSAASRCTSRSSPSRPAWISSSRRLGA
jgi:hypothetical protein